MKKNFLFLAVAALGFASCNSGFKKSDGGLLYNIHEDKEGANIKAGDFVVMNLIVKNDADSVLNNSYDQGMPVITAVPQPQYKGDVVNGILLLSQGDSATIRVNVDSAKAGNHMPKDFKGKYLTYQVKVEKVVAKGKLSDQVFQGRVAELFKAETAKMEKAEPVKIQKYLDENSLKPTKTASGLYYVITKEGSGPKIGKGDSAVVNYTGKLINGKVFDTSIKEVAQKNKGVYNAMRPYKPIRIAVGVGSVIPGWDEGLQLLNKGSKATFVIPSKLAYGQQGAGPIPPYTPIVFEVELIDIVHPDPNAPKPAAMPQMPAQQPTTK